VTARRPPRDPERGSATVWVLALSGVLAVLGAAVLLVGSAVVARHRAGAAADMAALAGAGRVAVGDPAACGAAAAVARADGAVLDACDLEDGGVVAVRVRITVRFGPFGVLPALARARAGPAPPGG
jgi:secretion/DNA translocation related TadE-like protein